ncbi:hypothetical protein R1flu_005248 [Riccia fluitans]|uniref:Uncharacterized protein n=1 Tax=Riccia fluitans TaxID=41844 RepID=A0ABD1YSM0_9MARC
MYLIRERKFLEKISRGCVTGNLRGRVNQLQNLYASWTYRRPSRSLVLRRSLFCAHSRTSCLTHSYQFAVSGHHRIGFVVTLLSQRGTTSIYVQLGVELGHHRLVSGLDFVQVT